MAVRRQEDVMREFIITYQAYPCLWKIKSKEYTDRKKKEDAYWALVHILKQINPDADVEVVKKKINSLRSCFRKEYKKVLESKRPGADSANIYTPSLWYFDLLLFLKEQESPRNSIGTEEHDLHDYLTRLKNETDSDTEVDSIIQSPPATFDMTSTSSSFASVSARPSSVNSQRNKIPKMGNDCILQVVGEKFLQSRVEDEFDIVGKNVAEKLRKLDPNMRIFAEKIINDTLFEAQLGTLNRNAYLMIPEPPYSRVNEDVKQGIIESPQ